MFSINDNGNERMENMAGFLQSWQAFQRGDYLGIPVQLDLGIPSELADHGLYLRARALKEAGQGEISRSFWEKLANDSTSVFASEALYELAVLSQEASDIEAFLNCAERHRTQPSSNSNRQTLDLQAAKYLTAIGKHSQAVEILYRAYLAAPAETTADRILEMLSDYPRDYGLTPRSEMREEAENELARLEQSRSFRTGLNRVRLMMQTANGTVWGDFLGFYKGRFENGLGRHRDAIGSLDGFIRRYPNSRYLHHAFFFLGRSAYLTDQDTLAISALLEAADQGKDLELSGRALDLLGVLYLDRKRPADAENAYRRWETLGRGSSTEDDCLWRLGWALWENGKFGEAGTTWRRLYDLDSTGSYAPGSLYWSARAAAKNGHSDSSNAYYTLLAGKFPYSYYSIVAGDHIGGATAIENPLTVPTLDEIWNSGGLHARRFCLLAAMRLPDLALREWTAVRSELSARPELAWWEAQLNLWRGHRLDAMQTVRRELSPYILSAGRRPDSFFSTVYPLDFDPQIIQLSRQYGVDPYLAFALICQESHYESEARSGAGAIGLMQLMPATARKEARKLGLPYSERKLRDPDYNLRLGIFHIAGLLVEYHGDSVLAISAYNAGKTVTEVWMAEFGQRDRDEFIELIPYRETRLFVKRNIEHKAAYHRLYPDVVQSALKTPSIPHTEP